VHIGNISLHSATSVDYQKNSFFFRTVRDCNSPRRNYSHPLLNPIGTTSHQKLPPGYVLHQHWWKHWNGVAPLPWGAGTSVPILKCHYFVHIYSTSNKTNLLSLNKTTNKFVQLALTEDCDVSERYSLGDQHLCFSQFVKHDSYWTRAVTGHCSCAAHCVSSCRRLDIYLPVVVIHESHVCRT